jgi:hypothetical protein
MAECEVSTCPHWSEDCCSTRSACPLVAAGGRVCCGNSVRMWGGGLSKFLTPCSRMFINLCLGRVTCVGGVVMHTTCPTQGIFLLGRLCHPIVVRQIALSLHRDLVTQCVYKIKLSLKWRRHQTSGLRLN